jgi:hypothetical protein
MLDYASMLDELRETGTLDSESLALLEIQPQQTTTETIKLVGASDKQLRYAEQLRAAFFMRQVAIPEQFGTMGWLCNAVDDAGWWVAATKDTKNPLADQWVVRVLLIMALYAEQ